MNIVVLVKHVPDSAGDRRFTDDGLLDRELSDGRLSELDEYAVEQALLLAAQHPGSQVTHLTMGPDEASDALRKALAMGGDRGVHVSDQRLAGADYLTTSLVLAKAVQALGYDLVVCGMASTDGAGSVVPAMLAERLGVAHCTLAAQLDLDGSLLTIRRDGDRGSEQLSTALPAVASVTDRSGEPRYPTFKGILAAKKKPVLTWDLSDLGLDDAHPGLVPATRVLATVPRPARQRGTVVTDEGQGAAQLADFLAAHK